MKNLKQILTILMGGLIVLNAVAADAPNHPLHVLYLGPVDVGGGGGGGFGGARMNYVYLPGQTLAPEAIYFDYRPDASDLNDTYLNHFDAVVQLMPDTEIGAAQQKMLEGFKNSGNGLIKYTDGNRPEDTVLRAAVLESVSQNSKSAWEAYVASRPPLKRLSGEVPNYERRSEPVKLQAPLDPEDSMRYTQVPADFDLQLFAAEPDVVKPIYMAWDERGRAWVVEARDYPHVVVPEGEPGHDDIKICEDTDGDGRADKFTVFADGLNMATALVFVDGGIIVSEARHMLFLKDTDGDDKADVRQVILPGWGIGDTHAMQSNLQRGFDNWLYGAVGYSNFRGSVGGEDLQFGQGIFRFKADGSALEFLHQFNNNTWGFGQNADGDIFGSTANGNPTFYGYLPAYILNPTQPGFGRRGGGGGGGGFRRGYRIGPPSANTDDEPAVNVRRLPSAKSMAPGMRMHPNTPNVRMVDNFGGYTAAAGHAFMVSDALPPRLQGKALVTEPTAKLIGIMDIEQDGAGYQADDGFNLLASTDEWMSPIFADVGPDGAVWVIDFYSFIIQHNPTPNLRSAGIEATTGVGGAYMTENNLRDQIHGRIYRVVWKDGPKSPIQSLAGATASELVQALDSGNQFWSLTAQRLIVGNKMTDAVPPLKKRVRSGSGGKGAIHALWALEGIGALDKDTHQAALSNKDAALRRNAIRALPSNEAGRQLFFSSPVIQDPDLLTRQAAFVKLLEFSTIPEIQTVVAQLSRAEVNSSDPFLNDSITLLGRIHNVSGVGENEVKITAGDAGRGEDLFRNSPVAACASCHMVNGTGGDVGPILDGIAVRSDKAYILESLMEPNAKLAKGYENLEISPMPPLGMLLKEQELADILAYLSTLTTLPKDGVTVPAKRDSEFE
jgi:putative membrane-bound dehydrogenase-like protein